jgi:hypothetical protein
MTQEPDTESFIDDARHRQEWQEQRARLQLHGGPARFTVRAVVEVLHDYLKEARVRGHHFRSDEAGPGGNDEAPNPLGYLVAAVGF